MTGAFSSAAPSLWNRLPDKASSKRHCFLSAAAEITFVFNFVIPSSPSPLSLPHVFLPYLSPPTPTPQPPQLPSPLLSGTSTWFSCVEPNCALRAYIAIDIVSTKYWCHALPPRRSVTKQNTAFLAQIQKSSCPRSEPWPAYIVYEVDWERTANVIKSENVHVNTKHEPQSFG